MLDLCTGKEMTRRETIKGGLGLAAILAAGKAPAMLLGARGVAFGKEPLPYASRLSWARALTINSYFDVNWWNTNETGFHISAARVINLSDDMPAFGNRSSTGNTRWFMGGYNGLAYLGWNTLYTITSQPLGVFSDYYLNFKNDRKLVYNTNTLKSNLEMYGGISKTLKFPAYGNPSGNWGSTANYYRISEFSLSRNEKVVVKLIPVITLENNFAWYDEIGKTFHTFTSSQYEWE